MSEGNSKIPGILEVANKKRHLFLLQKLHEGKSLSRSEIKELEKFEGKNPKPGIITTQEKLAQIFGVSNRTIRYWEKEGLPKTSEGFYNIADVQEWRFCNDKRRKNIPKKKEDEYESQFRKFKALLAEIEWKEKTKQLIPIGDVEKDNVQKIIAIKTKFLSLPRTIAPQLVGLEVQKIESILRIRIEEIVNDFASGKITHTKKKTK
ncbi:MAG: MerR family DNA-binding transcriptional regulator [Candidatus Omnitrophota bacterium]